MADEIKNCDLSKIDTKYNNIVEYAKDLKCEPVCKSNCKLCNSIYRKEAEALYAEGKNSYHIWKWLKSQNEDISSRGVHNHLNEHYEKPFIEHRMKVYAESLEDYSRIKMNEEERLNSYVVLLDQQIHRLGSTISNLHMDEMRRGQETLIKLIAEASKLQEQVRALKQSNEPVRILVERLNTVMTMKYGEAKTLEEKQMLSDIVELIVKETEIISNATK